MTNKTFKTLRNAIQQAMISIAYKKASDNLFDIDQHVDTAFDAIQYCFPSVQCITDTVTRDAAKTEINSAIEDLTHLLSRNDLENLSYLEHCFVISVRNGIVSKHFDALTYISNYITADSVMDDLIEMNEE